MYVDKSSARFGSFFHFVGFDSIFAFKLLFHHSKHLIVFLMFLPCPVSSRS